MIRAILCIFHIAYFAISMIEINDIALEYGFGVVVPLLIGGIWPALSIGYFATRNNFLRILAKYLAIVPFAISSIFLAGALIFNRHAPWGFIAVILITIFLSISTFAAAYADRMKNLREVK